MTLVSLHRLPSWRHLRLLTHLRKPLQERSAKVPRLLPQQQLVLELLRMSGEIAVVESAEGTILWRTLQECRRHLWITWSEVSPGVFSVSLTSSGRKKLDSTATESRLQTRKQNSA